MQDKHLTGQQKAEIDAAMLAKELERQAEELLAAVDQAQEDLLHHLRRRERKRWKARTRMPMHGKDLLRRRRKRRNEHILEG